MAAPLKHSKNIFLLRCKTVDIFVERCYTFREIDKWPVGQAVKPSCPLRKALIMLFRGELSEMRQVALSVTERKEQLCARTTLSRKTSAKSIG